MSSLGGLKTAAVLGLLAAAAVTGIVIFRHLLCRRDGDRLANEGSGPDVQSKEDLSDSSPGPDQHFRQVLETAPDAYLAMNPALAITSWSGPAERLFGWASEEVLGGHVVDTLIPQPFRGVGLAALQKFLPSSQGYSEAGRIEIQAVNSAGQAFPVEFTIWWAGKGEETLLHAVARNLSGSGVAEDTMLCVEGSIVNSSDDAIFSEDLNGQILTWNAGAQELFGYRASEIVDRPSSVLVPPDRHAAIGPFLDMARRGEHVPHHRTVRLRKDGSRVDVAVSMSPIHDATGAVIGVSSIARDVTSEVAVDAALEELSPSLQRALDLARREAEQHSRRFLADAAHQLKTPITRIQASAETLMHSQSRPERDHLVATTLRETSRAARIIQSLLQLARLDQGQQLNPKRCDLVLLCRDEAGRAQDLAPHLDVAVAVSGHSELRPELDADAVRDILANLLDNARRHAVTLIEMAITLTDTQVEIRVSDDGAGLDEDVAERVFARFVSLDGEGGSGLGLPIARGLARAHGGDIVYEADAFVVRLPAHATTVAHSSVSAS